MEYGKALLQVDTEIREAVKLHKKFNSAHEGLAVIEEEFEELKREVFKKSHERSIDRMREEAKQVAAMAIRFIIELT